MKKKLAISGMPVILLALVLVSAGCKNPAGGSGGSSPAAFVPVTGITLTSSSSGVVGTSLQLTGKAEPKNATNTTIVWSLGTGSTATGAAVADGKASATGPGTVVVKATIANGKAKTGTPQQADFTKDFTITFNAPPAAVTSLNLTSLVTKPVKGATPVTTAINETQYTGTIKWQDATGATVSGNFAGGTVYKAVVSLAVKTGFTFTGVAKDSFTYTGATVTNAANSGVVTITFAATAN